MKHSRSKAFVDTTLFCLSMFFLYADQNLLAPNLSAVAEVQFFVISYSIHSSLKNILC